MSEETLLHEVLALPPDQRAAFLDRACVGQPQLRAAVEALLRAHFTPDNVLDQPAAATQSCAPSLEAGAVFAGRYKIREKLGEGGMGVVYVAEQIEPVQRRVALKVIKTGLDSARVLARFEQERQALALMDHPNIAKVFDAGVSESGQPYFVMELIKGVPFTKFCDEAKLTPRQRLELFLPVCQAVQHAHQKGIIHRDLKPANILVALYDARPVPKVIDFGVAKATGPHLTEDSIYTAIGTLIGTVEYMSPEQAQLNNLDIDTRSDIYALGVILYELLTGSVPFSRKELKAAAFTEMLRIIKEVEPPKPSTRLSGSGSLPSIAAVRQMDCKKLTNLVRGELDWIVMKCLDKERSRRYETAIGLAMDLQRYLHDEPVLAGPPSASYRLRKFVSRNRGPVLAGALVVIALLLGIIGTTWGLVWANDARGAEAAQRLLAEDSSRKALKAAQIALDAQNGEAKEKALALANEKKALEAAIKEEAAKRHAEAERDKAAKARDRTRQVLDDMTSEITGDSLATQIEISAEQKKFLIEVLKYYRDFAGEQGDDEHARFRTAKAAKRVGVIEYRLGRKAESVIAFRQTRDAFAALVADFPAALQYRMELADSHNSLGVALNDLGKWTEAEAAHKTARALFDKLTTELPAVAEHWHGLALSQNNLGSLLLPLGRHAEAEAAYRSALEIRAKLAATSPDVPKFRQDLASTYRNLGILLSQLRNLGEAETAFRAALDIQVKLAKDFPTARHYQLRLSLNYSSLGLLFVDQGKDKEAESAYQSALRLLKRLTAEFPSVPQYRQDLANVHNNRGVFLKVQGKWQEAEAAHRDALALLDKLATDFPAVPQYRQDLATAHNNLGGLCWHLGKHTEAETAFRAALTLQEKLAAAFTMVPSYRYDLARSHSNLGMLFADLGKAREAEMAQRSALAIREKLAADFPGVPDYRQALGVSHNSIGNLLWHRGKFTESETAYRRALALQKELVAEFPAEPRYREELASSHNDLALLLAARGKRGEAEMAYNAALAIFEKLVAEFPAVPLYRRQLGHSRNNMANLLRDLGRHKEAEAAYRASLAIREKLAAEFPSVPRYQVHLANSYNNLGTHLGKNDEAEKGFKVALAILEKLVAQFPAVPDYRQDLARTNSRMARLLGEFGKQDEAVTAYKAAITIQENLSAEFPAVLDYKTDLGGSCCNLGNIFRNNGKPADSLEWYAKSIGKLAPVVAKEPAFATPRLFLRNAHWARAQALAALDRHDDALRDWDKAVELSVDLKSMVRAGRALSRVRVGKVNEAVAEAAELTKQKGIPAKFLYDFACIYSLASAKDKAKQDKYAERAVVLLRQAVTAGYKDVTHLKKDPDLDPLRRREDFRMLMAELEKGRDTLP